MMIRCPRTRRPEAPPPHQTDSHDEFSGDDISPENLNLHHVPCPEYQRSAPQLSDQSVSCNAYMRRPAPSVERLELVRFHRCLVLMQVRQGVLRTIVVGIVVRIDRLSLEPGNGIELLDSCCSKARQSTEHRALDLRD